MAAHPRPVRYRCELFARIDVEGAETVKARLLELSETGGFIEETPGLLEQQVGDEGSMTLGMPGGAPWVTRFRVCRLGVSRRDVRVPSVEHVTVSSPGYGVEFVELGDEALERLRDFLELLDER